MSISQDAGEILIYVYSKKIMEDKIPHPTELLEITQWKPMRLEHALSYCEQKGFLDIHKFMGSIAPGLQSQLIYDITSFGIDIIESSKEEGGSQTTFNTTFNLTININNPEINLTFGKISLLGV